MNAQDIVNLGKTSETKPLVLGPDVLEKDLATSHLYRFPRRTYIFLNLLHDGLTLEEAATKSNLDLVRAEEIRLTPEAQKYLEMRELREVVAREAKDPDRWWTDGFLAENGQKPMNKIQCEIWKERGKRVQPCSDASAGQGNITINISAEALEKSKERRRAIETQIVEELRDAV